MLFGSIQSARKKKSPLITVSGALKLPVLPHPKPEPVFSLEQAAFALLLIMGLYFPTSMNGEHSVLSVLIAFALLFLLLACLAWKHGIRREVATWVSLPIMIVLVSCTLFRMVNRPAEFDPGLFIKFSALALVFALDLRRLHFGGVVNRVFQAANFVNILVGLAILFGSEWITEILTKYYWISEDDLLPAMLRLHKPVLTFGIHSLAALYLYLFFFVNWEDYKRRGSNMSLAFSIGYFILLLGLTSFTSFGLGALALAQMGVWFWNRNPRMVIAAAICIAALVPLMAGILADEIDSSKDLAQLGKTFLNSELSGPVARFGPGGELRAEITHLFGHPFSPIGLARSESAFAVESPEHFYVGDSGPLEYLTRGSIPLLFLIYFGLYRFLRNNLALRTHSTVIFLAILAFETGYSALSASRTYFLLPFFVVYLNGMALAPDYHWRGYVRRYASQRLNVLPARRLDSSRKGQST